MIGLAVTYTPTPSAGRRGANLNPILTLGVLINVRALSRHHFANNSFRVLTPSGVSILAK